MMPIGTAINDPRPVRISVPTIALAMPPPGSPTGFGMCRKKSRFSDWTPSLQHEEQDEGQRHQRDQHGERAEADENGRQQLAAGGPAHAAVASAGAAAAAARERLPLRAMLQINSRERPLTTKVMMNSTRPISTSASRYS